MKNANDVHKLGTDAKILLTGVFGPFAQDDEYGSREVNPMELYHNQVTRVQGPFSLRMFHRTFGLLLIEANIDAPCTILEFPTLDRFTEEIKNKSYDIIGINAIVPNILKVEKMCREIRKYQPDAEIVVGGHIASMDNLDDLIDADHLCKGDGIKWFRNYLGEDIDVPIKHPAIISGFGTRMMGMPIPSKNTAGVLIPSVGCPMGCNFCSTSALFGGKGNSVNFFETGDELFSVLCQLEEKLKVNAFFVLDENFLLYKERSLRLLELMEQNNKSWEFYIFSSARVLMSYSKEQLIALGVSWVWLGLEGEDSKYNKLNGVDTLNMVKDFQSHGIRVLGSTIIGMEEHTPENINAVIDFAVSHDTDFHQFMLYTPLPGTPLYREHKAAGNLLSEEECPHADAHGQEKFNFHHKHIRNGQENDYLLEAFIRDFKINGPSIMRITRTTLKGWERYINHPDKRIATRFKRNCRGLSSVYPATVWAMKWYFRKDQQLKEKISYTLNDIYRVFGLKTRILAPIIGFFLTFTVRREERKLSKGWKYEPETIYEKNSKAMEIEKEESASSKIKIPEIHLPVYDFSHVLAICRERMEEIKYNILTKCEQSVEELQQLYEGVNLRSSNNLEETATMAEYMTQKSEIAKEGIMQIRENISDRYEHVCNELKEIRDTMKVKYEMSESQIEQLYEQMLVKCEGAMNRVSKACDSLSIQLDYDVKNL